MNKEAMMLAALDRVMRTLKRRPAGKQRLGRGGYRLLKLISEQPNSPTRVLAERLGMRTSSLNERLVRMEAEGVITRERDAKDQRVFLVNIAPAGEAVLETLRLEREAMSQVIEEILTEEEIDKMTELADKLSRGLKEVADKAD
ncbi:MarR family transcriptional regulator [Aerococcaceae bacterium WS4759]|uniref:MarR family transcriptional regulator n=1 Tax=Fundicoccus ignavus TaxID=2664442 RepID=A0A6I2GG99_9LACT|nr:MarR family transcriptional regulator [Fundicoccus ignavus]MRI84521.1 MarR family transcriptional regulator [Fundicoccus ignavus]